MECSLGKGEVLRLDGGPGLLIRCRRGGLWITTGDGRDYVIRGGESFQVGQGCSALAEALGPVEMCVESAGQVAGSAAISLTAGRKAPAGRPVAVTA